MNLTLSPRNVALETIEPGLPIEAVKNILIPKGIDILGSNCFNNYKDEIESIDLSKSEVTVIEEGTFSNMKNLKSIKLPHAYLAIPDEAFSGCTNLKIVNFSYGVKSIGTHAFYKCESLEAISIPGGCTLIDKEAFAYCTSLKYICLPVGECYLSENIFLGCNPIEIYIT